MKTDSPSLTEAQSAPSSTQSGHDTRPSDSIVRAKNPSAPMLRARFDYAPLDSNIADDLRRSANRIRHYRRSVGIRMIEIGVSLLSVRGRLPHGQFGLWLRTEFGWSERTAQNYMRVAELFQAKSETFADLPTAFIYKIAAPSTPEDIRRKVVEDLEAGHTIDRRAILREIQNSRSHGLLEKMERPENAVQEANAILANLTISQRRQLLRLLESSAVRAALNDTILTSEVEVEAVAEEFPDIPNILDRREKEPADDGGS